MSAPRSLESMLEQRLAKDPCKQCSFWANYVAMKKYLEQHYYPWVHNQCPWYTDHGAKHVDSVIHTASALLSAVGDDQLSCLDIYLLLCSIIWHDVGMVAGRTNHAAKATEVIDQVREFCFPDLTLYRLVAQITRAHSGPNCWAGLLPSEPVNPCTHASYNVFPKALAAVLRFADEISETRTRVSHAILDNVPDPQKIFWHFAHAITASQPEPLRQRLLLALEIDRRTATRRFQCLDDPLAKPYADADGTISLIEYVVSRLEKINNERAYCFPYLTRFADIRTVVVRICITETDPSRVFTPTVYDDIVLGDGGLSSAEYPRVGIFSRFFETYPKLTPAELAKGI